MLATARIEALELWVASEIVGPIIDKAISVVRRRILVLRRSYKRAKKRLKYWKDREAQFPEAVRNYSIDIEVAITKHDRAYRKFYNKLDAYNGYREWQNLRWGLAQGSRYSALPEAARHTHPAP